MIAKASQVDLKREVEHLEAELGKARKALEALRESNAKHRLLLEKMTDTVWTLDMNMRPTYVSPATIEVLGYAPEERLTQHLSEMVTPETYARICELLGRELEKEREGTGDPDRTVQLEMEYYHKNGGTVWLENKVRAIRGQDGRVIGIHGVSRDITQRKMTEEALRRSEERFRQISCLTTDIIYSCVADTGGVFSIDWLSGDTETIAGFTIDEIKAQSCWRFLVMDEDLPLFDRHVTGLPPGQSMSTDLRLRHKDGRISWVTSYAECIEDATSPGGCRLYGGLVDVTNRKQIEEALKNANDQLEAANRELGHAYAWMRDKKDQLKRQLDREEMGILLDIAGSIEGVSEKVMEYLGKSRDSLIGQGVRELIKEEYRDDFFRALRQAWMGSSDDVFVEFLDVRDRAKIFDVKLTRMTLSGTRLVLMTLR
ncbi:MAG TPA: PAS domain S-box protein [Syntrophales bacterium]|nr:PAS domain S-box protein [Syntrophales bacterium]